MITSLFTGNPLARLSLFYLLWFGSLGVLIPYWALYLKGRGFDPIEIGELMAMMLGAKVVAQNFWAWVADRMGRGLPVIRLGLVIALLSIAGFFIAESYIQVALVMVVFGLSWNSVPPQLESITLRSLGDGIRRYGRVRLWGSVGFIVTVLSVGVLIDHTSSSVTPLVMLFFILMMVGVSLVLAERGDDRGIGEGVAQPRMVDSLRKPVVWGLLVSALLMQVSHSPLYVFFTIYLKDAGYQGDLIGGLWTLGVVGEIVVFYLGHRIFERFDLGQVLVGCFLVAMVRWGLTGFFVDSLFILVIAQLLHAITFGAYHASAVQLIHAHFPNSMQYRGQALYGSLSYGVGGAIGSLQSGYTWAHFGPEITFMISGFVALLGGAVAWATLPGREKR